MSIPNRQEEKAVHIACMHQYYGSVFAIANYRDSSVLDRFRRPIMLVQHPRWCENCITSRERALHVLHVGHLRQLTDSNLVLQEYLRGLRDGRIAALRMTWVEIRDLWMEVTDLTRRLELGAVSNISEMMADVQIAPRNQGDEEKQEEVMELLRNASIGADSKEMKDSLRERVEAYVTGRDEGVEWQALKEYAACEERDEDKKQRLLNMALC